MNVTEEQLGPHGPVGQTDSSVPPLTGPDGPLPGAEPPRVALPVVPAGEGPRLWVVGAHGGAGESTIAGLDSRWAETHHRWPIGSREAPQPRCVLVARTHMRGMLHARDALAEWASGRYRGRFELLGLIWIKDAPKDPKGLREFREVVSGAAPRVWVIEWISAARYESELPRYGWAFNELHRNLTGLLASTAPTPPYNSPPKGP